MFHCAQLDMNDVCRTVARLKTHVDEPNIIPLHGWRDVIGWRYDRTSGRFYHLATDEARVTIAVGQPVMITVSYRDEEGALVESTDSVTASSADWETEVMLDGGVGEFEFIPIAPGQYFITIRSACGMQTHVEVTAE